VGLVLIMLILLGGRMVRRHMLVDPQGQWRQELWLDELVRPASAETATEPEAEPRLTLPLPINVCSRDSLTLLPGVGPVLADRIDKVRETGVVFRRPEDLKIVKGIGPALSARLGAVVDFREPDPGAASPDSLPRPEADDKNSR
jgi:hypothetical protein